MSEYLTIGEAAEMLGVSKDTLRRWDRSGDLKARRHPVSRYRLYVRRDLEQFLHRLREDQVGEQHERTVVADPPSEQKGRGMARK
ncbi:MAG: helix-turn-helix domain-containing protein [Phycisphaerae bacterium]|nr:helix-turn-helix domain-containing protein [Phycisphaerae bacterium]